MAKRKNNYYAVVAGRKTGIFDSWEACEAQVKGFPNAKFHGFRTREQAESYLLAENEAKKQRTTGDFGSTATTATATPTWADLEQQGNAAMAAWMHPPPSLSSTSTSSSGDVKMGAVEVKGEAANPFNVDEDDSPMPSAPAAPAAVRNPYSNSRAASIPKKEAAAAAAPPPPPLYDTRMFVDEAKRKALSDDRKMRITDVLARKLAVQMSTALTLSDDTPPPTTSTTGRDGELPRQQKKMEGDIMQLALHTRFFVGGVCIGWPYPKILSPQRQMAMRLVAALQKGLHTVLESPTGTGKSAAILCTALAWQRYHQNTPEGKDGPVPKIFYCSRTHSQVAQMVASLKKTPYRPRMTILGSRERLCIHREINPRDGTEVRKVDINQACRVRVSRTEKERRRQLKGDDRVSPFGEAFLPADAYDYDDDNPPTHRPGDGDGRAAGDIGDDSITSNRKPALTCPHYRQMTSERTAVMAQEKFAPTTCCSTGGEKTQMGAVDIEDLVGFGLNPYRQNDVAIYRPPTSKSWGIKLAKRPNNGSGCMVHETLDAAADEGTLKRSDYILKINGKDMRHASLDTITAEAGIATSPLELDVLREAAMGDDDTYSPHSVCPYYMSRALTKHAELVLTPYNYILDPDIRAAMGISLEGAVVVLDEGHNVEATLREAGSGRFSELELCEVINVLEPLARSSIRRHNEKENGDEKLSQRDVAHELLLFVEAIVAFLRDARERFEKNPGPKGAQAAIGEWRKYHTPDDKEFEVDYFGPSGRGERGKAVGCKPFFERLQAAGISTDGDKLLKYAAELAGDRAGDAESDEEKKENASLDLLVGLFSKLSMAMSSSEHFYISSVMHANGSLDFASGGDGTNAGHRAKKPKELPFAYPRKRVDPEAPLPVCTIDKCSAKGSVCHGKFCDGSTPKWEAVLVLELLTPSLLLRPVADSCRTLVIASGSLAPLPSLCAELGLHPASEEAHKSKSPVCVSSPPEPQTSQVEQAGKQPVKAGALSPKPEKEPEHKGRLLMKPGPLEANHVVNLDKQLRAVSIGTFPDGSPLTVTYKNYRLPGFYVKLGHAIASIVEAIPHGGVLVFLPSYTFLKNCLKAWKLDQYNSRSSFDSDKVDADIWRRFVASKKKVIVEPSGGGQEAFEESKLEFTESIGIHGKALLLAVFRGKMSEGISFNDDNARGVICVGLPLPSSFDRSITAKKDYNDEQRRLNNNASLLPGQAWYQQQAYRAIAQALGRCIRHIGDYGTVVLLDRRHCDDGAPTGDGVCGAHRNLPKWMRTSVRNLSMSQSRFHAPNHIGNAPITGGYAGLTRELSEFFANAKDYTEDVLEKCEREFEAAKAKGSSLSSPKFTQDSRSS